jgi:hypothetical protein
MAMSSLAHLTVPKAPSRTARRKERQSRSEFPANISISRISCSGMLDRGEERTCTNASYTIEYNEVQDSRRKTLNELIS